MRYWLFACALAILAICAFRPVPAVAGLHVCNKTSQTIWFAYAYEYDCDMLCDEDVEGWWKIAPDDCSTPIGRDLDSDGVYHYYAHDDNGGTWSGQASFCVDSSAFTFDLKQEMDCDSGMHQKFRKLSFSGTDYTLNLTP